MTDLAEGEDWRALDRCLKAAEVAHIGESSVLLYVSMPKWLWELISADGT